jgi:hypothetical protein
MGISSQLRTGFDRGLQSSLSAASPKTKFLAPSTWLICGRHHNQFFSEPRQSVSGGSLNQHLAGGVRKGFSEPGVVQSSILSTMSAPPTRVGCPSYLSDLFFGDFLSRVARSNSAEAGGRIALLITTSFAVVPFP